MSLLSSFSFNLFLRCIRSIRNFVFGVIFLGGGVFFYLSFFPISLDLLKPVFRGPAKNMGISLKNTHLALTWRKGHQTPAIEVYDFKIDFMMQNKRIPIAVSHIYLLPSWGKLFQGKLRFQSVVLKDPTIPFSEDSFEILSPQETLRLMIEEVFSQEELKKIKKLTIENPFPALWPHLVLDLTRNYKDLRINLCDQEGAWGEALLTQDLKNKKLHMGMTLKNLPLPPSFLPVKLGCFPSLSGKIQGFFSLDTKDQEGTFEIEGENFYVSQNSQNLEKVLLKGGWTHERMTLSQGVFQKEGVVAEINAAWWGLDDPSKESKASLQAKIGTVSLEQLPRFWPEGLANSPRIWILENIPEGEISGATLNLSLGFDSRRSIISETLSGTLLLDQLTVHYLEGMPPVKKVKGRAVFSEKDFDIKIISGVLQSQKLLKGNIWITGLDLPDQNFKTSLKLKGPLTDFFKILSFPPLEYTQKISIPLKSMEASAETLLDISFPLEKNILLSQVDLKAQGRFRNFSYKFLAPFQVKPLLFKRGDLELFVTTKKLDMKGKAFLNDSPVQVLWKENFENKQDRKITFKSDMTPSTLNQWGVHLENLTQEAFPLEINYQPYHPIPFTFEADLSPVNLKIAPLNWVKEKGKPATLRGTFKSTSKGSQVDNLTFKAPEMSVKGHLSLSPTYTLETLLLSEIKSERQDCTLHFQRTSQGNVLSVKGKSGDLEGLMDFSKEISDTPSHDSKEFRILVDLEKVYMGGDDPLYHLRGSFKGVEQNTGFEITKATVGAKFSPDTLLGVKSPVGTVSLTIQKLTPADEQSFLLESDNGGAFLKTLGVIGNVKKGRLKMIGSRKNNRAPLKAKISLEKFIVTKTPFLTHFLMTLASPTSFLDLFSNGKIKFNEFFCHVLLEGPLLTVQQGLFQSFNSGISLEGSLNLKDHTMKLEGNLIPAYMLNKPLSIIPILGDILGGGHGDGIGATRFFVDGAIQDPRIRVNPIRIIAPGILKKLFSSFGKSSQEETVKEQKKN